MFAPVLEPVHLTPAVVPLGVATLLAWFLIRSLLSFSKVPSVTVGIPVLGNLIQYSKDPVEFIASATRQYGQCFTVPMLLGRTVWLRSPQLNKEYLETREDVWSFGDGMGFFLNKIVVPGYFDHLRAFVGSLSRGISRQVTLDHYGQVAEEEAVKSIGDWSQIAQRGEPMPLFEEVSFLVHKIIVRCLMGPDFYDHHVTELFDLLHSMEANVGSILHTILPGWVPHTPARRLWAARDRIREIFELRLREREKNPEEWQNSLDYISYTLRDPSTAHLSRFYGAHHTLLMFAAHTSTVASISWTILELLKSPDRLRTLRQELAVNPRVEQSAFLDALVKETGRHYSGNSDVRWARQSKTLRNVSDAVTIPAGTVVSISPYLTHHDPEVWTNPESYTPERWMEQPDLARKMNDGTQLRYIPFGGGSHRCPGEKMAVMISKLVVSTVVQQCELHWGEGGESQDTATLDFSKVGSPWLKGDVQVNIRRI
ncbi:hypothetical protein EYZ11_007762 [Aspergillus tanneri]|uniref:Cytochrome P450-dit2 n=1 Tax=Aspergillus tanneri TaxID=1220188 RepID=A0A4S3JCE7_9EURO|nr:uncharacterized protein ATNIH1004_002126 [Aspergillus tanneri]KAA8649455.1 hypothetical protein ATNIH1004_002126 [Aspergillus tanneri]THC92770.1 hypothetical protein EYZ11_007762 [Aspergillus tanneri]